MVYFGDFFVLPDSVQFAYFYAKTPYFYADILSPSLYFRMQHQSIIRGWSAHVAQSRRGVGCEVGQEKKYFCVGGHKTILARNLLRQS